MRTGALPAVSRGRGRRMNPVNPKKLENAKWTAVTPRRREKHFIVTAVRRDDAGAPQTCVLEAVHSRRELELDWRELRDPDKWRIGWV
jgi:tryptophan-rich hypothetical protein